MRFPEATLLGRVLVALAGGLLVASAGTSAAPLAPIQIGGTPEWKTWCAFHDQSYSSPEACVGPVSICSFGPPKVECCTHLHEALKWWQCAQGGERRKGPIVKKYYMRVQGQCFLDQCIESPALPCPEHWVEECKTLDCF